MAEPRLGPRKSGFRVRVRNAVLGSVSGEELPNSLGIWTKEAKEAAPFIGPKEYSTKRT